MLDPFLPDAARKIREALGQSAPPALEAAVVGRLTSVPRVTKISGLFPRVDTKAPAAPPTTLSPRGEGRVRGPEVRRAGKIAIADFQKVELRVAEVLAAERVPKSKKLLKLSIRVGEETRTLVAGVAEHYEPGRPRRPQGGDRGQPAAGHAHGGGVERDGARGRARRHAVAAHSRQGLALRRQGQVVRAVLGETFRLLVRHLHLFTLISLTVWLPVPRPPQLPRVLRPGRRRGRARAADRPHRAGGARSVRGERAAVRAGAHQARGAGHLLAGPRGGVQRMAPPDAGALRGDLGAAAALARLAGHLPRRGPRSGSWAAWSSSGWPC